MNNRAEAINIRRETVGLELTSVHGAIRFLESILVQNLEENNEAPAILHSLMDLCKTRRYYHNIRRVNSSGRPSHPDYKSVKVHSVISMQNEHHIEVDLRLIKS